MPGTKVAVYLNFFCPQWHWDQLVRGQSRAIISHLLEYQLSSWEDDDVKTKNMAKGTHTGPQDTQRDNKTFKEVKRLLDKQAKIKKTRKLEDDVIEDM